MVDLQVQADLTKQWFLDHGLICEENLTKQTLKLFEEAGELAAGIARKDDELTRDAMGDILVVLIGLATIKGWKLEDILGEVYEIISKRKGLTVDGIFIKKEDFLKRPKEEQQMLFERASFKDLA
jgi:DNA-binding helix-turn-helix protein